MVSSEGGGEPDGPRRYAAAVVLSVAAAALRWGFAPSLGDAAPYVLAFAAAAAAAWYGGVGPGLLATALSAFLVLVLFIPPRPTLVVPPPYRAGLFAYAAASVIVVVIADQNRRARSRARASAADAARHREWLRVTLASLGDAVVAADTRGRVTILNHAAEALTGWTEGEALGRPLDEVLRITDETTRTPVESPVARILREGRVVGLANHTVLTARDGTARPIADSAAPIRAADGTVVGAVLVLRDLSEARRSERALAESEATYRLLSEELDQIVWTTRPDGTVEYANRRWFEYTGATPSQTASHGWLAPLHPDDLAAARDRWEEAVATGAGFETDLRFRRASDGSYRWHITRVHPVRRDDGLPSRWLGTALDVEDRRRIVEALRVSEERLRLAQEGGRLGTWDYDVAAQTVTWSASLEVIHGLAPGTFPGTFEAYQRDFHPDDRDRVLASIRRAVEHGVPHQAEYRFIRPDGSVHWVEARARPFLDADGRVYRVLGICMDVTERKRVEENLRHALALAEEAGRAKDRFMAMLSHELRTPLAPVLLAAEEMATDLRLPARYAESVEVIRRNVELEVRLIDDLLDVTRVVHGKLEYRFETVDVHALLRRTLDVVHGDLKAKRIDLQVESAAAACAVRADAGRLQQVLWNLLKNAVKFTPEGGAVRVRTWDEAEANRLVVEVSDTGLGIDEASLPRIFNAFEQGEVVAGGEFGGLGLGLAISRAIVAAHGGELTAASPGRNQGSTFRVTLPVPLPSPLPSSAVAPSDTPAPPTPPDAADDGGGITPGDGRPLRLLLVEDDPVTARIMARLLRNQGYAVTTANTLAAARAVPIDDIDLLVSDLGLPDGNGLDLMRAVAAHDHRHVPGIALTGFGMEDDVRRCHEAGFVAHLTKPVDFSRLDALIRRVASDHAHPADATPD